jgi:hypothetical protein
MKDRSRKDLAIMAAILIAAFAFICRVPYLGGLLGPRFSR